MAKTQEFKIKVDGKQVDLAKVSFKDFSKIISDAKKNLKELPLTDPRYKQLSTDIKTAEKAWKEATKAANEFNGENQNGAEDVRSYRSQIKDLELELIKVEQQFGKNSDQAATLRTKLGELRDQQSELKTTTQDLDDSLAALPGPIGKIGQTLGNLEGITRNAKGAFGNLAKQFPILDNAWKATGIGLLVGLIIGLVAAVVKAAQSFKPLQDAFAGIQDAVGSVLEALKPFTDFVLDVVVGAINLASNAITGLLSAFGATTNGFKKNTLELERSLKNSKDNLEMYGSFYSEWAKKINEFEDKQAEKRKKINEDETLSAEEKRIRLKEINDSELDDQLLLIDGKMRIIKKAELERQKNQNSANNQYEDNQRKSNRRSIEIEKEYSVGLIKQDINASYFRLEAAKNRIADLKKIENQGSEAEKSRRKTVISDLEITVSDEEEIIRNLEKDKKTIISQSNSEINKIQREANREDIARVKEFSIKTLELTTSLIKEENARNLQAAKDRLISLKEEQRLELEGIKLIQGEKSNVYKEAVKKQAAETKLANEQLRRQQIEYDAYLIQLEIDKQQRLVTEAGFGTQEYFDARKEIINKEFEKELLLADNNENEMRNARTKFWKAIYELDKEGLQAQINQISKEYDGLYEGTAQFYQKQRELEEANFKLRQKEYQNNYDMLEALNREHQKNMALINASEAQNRSDLEMRKFQALGTMRQAFFDEAVKSENSFFEAEKIRAGDNTAALEVIELEHNKRLAEINAQKKEATLQVYSAIATIVSDFGSVLSDIANQQLQAAQGTDEARFESAKNFAKAAIIVERIGSIAQIVANTGIANSKAVAASFITGGQPWVTINTVAAGISIAGIIASAVKSINEINNQKFEPAGGSGLVRGMARGGFIDGPRHAQGGTLIEAEGGEAVMNRGSVTMFGPLLAMMNQAGGGVNFNKDMLTTANDAPVSSQGGSQEPVIMKTYVVSNELTSEQEKQARLKQLSTL